jgi:hypothetical protein
MPVEKPQQVYRFCGKFCVNILAVVAPFAPPFCGRLAKMHSKNYFSTRLSTGKSAVFRKKFAETWKRGPVYPQNRNYKQDAGFYAQLLAAAARQITV